MTGSIKNINGLYTQCKDCSGAVLNQYKDGDAKTFDFLLEITNSSFPVADPIPPKRLQDCTNNQSACNHYYPDGAVRGFRDSWKLLATEF